MHPRLKLFYAGFIQVFLVAVNTVFLSRQFYGGVAVASFLISLFWTYNVKRVAFGTTSDRYIYAAGAMVGGVGGLWFSGVIS